MANRIDHRIFNRLCKITNCQLDRLLNYKIEMQKFYLKKGYKLNLREPKSFCEKVIWKKIYDRNPLLQVTADKYRVRYYIKDVLGKDRAEEILVTLLYVTDDPENIPFEKLKGSYIVKPNHMSGAYFIVNKHPEERDKIVAMCKKWLTSSYGLDKNEWAYQNTKRKIIIEKLLLDENGDIPDDYKLFMFHGKCRLIQHCYGRLSEGKMKNDLYSPKWEHLDVKYKDRQGSPKPKPVNLKDMITIAEDLSKPFDFIRVDFYSVSGKIYIGELTHYPGSGKNKIDPVEFDFELGSYWKIQPEYWLES
jgi:hypothetical protein